VLRPDPPSLTSWIRRWRYVLEIAKSLNRMPPAGLLTRQIGPETAGPWQRRSICKALLAAVPDSARPAHALNKTASKMGSCYSLGHELQRPEERYFLSQLYAQQMCIFWHEGLADLTGFIPSKYLKMTHRQEMHWQVGFVLYGAKGDSRVSVPEIQAEELKQRLDKGENLFLLDVRDEYEYEISNIGGHLIPLAELPKRYKELNVRQEIVAVCKMGPRGVKAVEFLRQQGFKKVRNLSGGIHAWSDRVDRKVRKY
jgi:rhodanese-related sulfurtransferase